MKLITISVITVIALIMLFKVIPALSAALSESKLICFEDEVIVIVENTEERMCTPIDELHKTIKIRQSPLA